MSILNETYTLNNGNKIPRLGFGTWLMEGTVATDSVCWAIETGYRHIDTAVVYDNESSVGLGIRESGVPREELFVTSKIPSTTKTYDGTKEDIRNSLARLGLDYLDLMLIHWPQPFSERNSEYNYAEENRAVWRAMEEAYEAGQLKAIGVSNFEMEDLEQLLETAEVKPMVNQIQLSIGYMTDDLVSYCQERDILVEAYSPLARGRVFENELAKEIAEENGVTVGQLSLRYLLQKGLLPLPKSATKKYIEANTKLDFTISDDAMARLDGLGILYPSL